MIKVQVDKVWLGKVSVRDYIYKKALREDRVKDIFPNELGIKIFKG